MLPGISQASHLHQGTAPESKAYIYYIDVRAMGKYEDFYTKVDQDENVNLIKSKIAADFRGS